MNVTLSNVESFLSFLQNSTIMLRDQIGWIEPSGLALLGAYCDQHALSINNYLSSDAQNYLNITRQYHRSGKNYYPLTKFLPGSGMVETISKSIAQTLIHQDHFSSHNDAQDFIKYLQYSIAEVLNNISDHSESLRGGYVAAQFYPANKTVKVAIADTGIGLRRSLSRKYTILNDMVAIEKALEKFVSGSMIQVYGVPKNSGVGLFALSKIVDETNGRLVIISKNAMCSISNGSRNIQHLKYGWDGTFVAFEINDEGLDYNFEDFKKIHIWNNSEEEDEFF